MDDLKAVIDAKCAQWGQDERMREYLRPSTLFQRSKFDEYLANARVPARQARAPAAQQIDFSAYD